MPQIGEVQKGKDIGFKGHVYFVWHACIDCNKERWVRFVNGIPQSLRCYPCSRKAEDFPRGEAHKNWRGGKYIDSRGYIMVRIFPDNPFYPMAQGDGYIPEHRLVIARSLNRCLNSQEIVHHKGIRHSDIKNKSDNLEDNLELTATIGEHVANHSKGYKDGFQKGYADGMALARR